MKKYPSIYFFVLLLGLVPTQLSGQLSDDFSDENIISSPVWFGNIQDFKVNESQELQLNATSAGKSMLCTDLQLPDSIRWEFYIRLEFATSASNKLRIYLMLDTLDLNTANGYFIEIGQNGSPDPIHLFSLENGESFLLGSSIISFEEEVNLNLSIILTTNGHWTFYAGTGNNKVDEVLTLNDASFSAKFNKLFCIECYYSATRADRFIFDNIKAGPFIFDKAPPVLNGIEVLDSASIVLIFNENIGANINPKNIIITPDIEFPDSILIDHHKLHIKLNKELISGETYLCSTNSIPDTAQNLSAFQEKEFHYIKISSPAHGDIAINEVLFDPNSNDSPFIELYNTSSKYIRSNDLLVDIIKDNIITTQSLQFDVVMPPDSFIVLTMDSASTSQNYPSGNGTSYLQTDLPTLSRKFGSIVLRTASGATIDSIFYHEDFHHSLLDDSRGVSLERISPVFPAMDAADWNSASEQSGWGTPGLPNSQYLRLDSIASAFHLENKIFSPDGDGYEDYLLIRFADEVAGQLATVRIFDEFGREVVVLLRNQLLGSGSTGKWDGTIEMRDKAPTGIYILLIELLQETGITTSYKEAIILATGI